MSTRSYLNVTVLMLIFVLLFGSTSGAAMLAAKDSTDNLANLLINGGFEEGYGVELTHWAAITAHPGGEFLNVSEYAFDGGYSARISALTANDMRLAQSITLEMGTDYALSGWIKTRDVVHEPGSSMETGAHLSLMDNNGPVLRTDALVDDNDWQLHTLNFNSEENTEVTVAARVGFSSSLASGTAWFDNLKLFEIVEGIAFDLQHMDSYQPYGAPGKTVVHTLGLVNIGSSGDTYDVTVTSESWPASGPSSFGPIIPGESEMFEIAVDIPPGTDIGFGNEMTVAVTSRANPALTHEVTLYTRASDCPDKYEPNDTPAQATPINFGQTLSDIRICPNDDTDYFVFVGADGERISADLDAPPIYDVADHEMQLLDTDGATPLAVSVDRDGPDPRIEYTLPANGDYYLRVSGDYGNEYLAHYSLGLSQVPQVQVAPVEAATTVFAGEIETGTLQISNQGSSTLTWQALSVNGAADAAPSNLSGSRVASSYSLKDSDDAGGPVYQWIEIARPEGGVGTEIENLSGFFPNDHPYPGCDTSHPYTFPIDLPFTFEFYGQAYDQIAVGVSGVLHFEDMPLGSCIVPIPSANMANVDALIAPYWGLLTSTWNGAVYYQDLGSVFVVEYYNLSPIYSSTGGAWQVWLFENGSILFQYREIHFGQNDFYLGWQDAGGIQSIGIQGDENTGLQYSYLTQSLKDEFAICFAPAGQSTACEIDIPWLTVFPENGAVEPGGSTTVELYYDPAPVDPLAVGDYVATLLMQSNDPSAPTVQTPVTMTVVNYGVTLDAAEVSRLGAPGETVSYPISVTNAGTSDDSYAAQLTGNSWPASAMPPSTAIVAPAAQSVISVTTTIPHTAPLGAVDTITVTLVSQGDSKETAALTLTTVVDRMHLYLPHAER